jgi:transposase
MAKLAPTRVPSELTLISLPPYAPELNPVARVRLYLRERFRSHRLINSNAAAKPGTRSPQTACDPSLDCLWITEVTS